MSKSFKLSKEHEIFASFMKCPLCNQFPIVPKYFQGNGTPISRNVAIFDMDISAIAECPRCKQRWSVFASSQSGGVSKNISRSSVKYNEVHSKEILEVSKFQLVETERCEEPLGSERRIIDNSKSAGRLTRKFTISKEWSKNYTVDFEKIVKAQGEISFNPLKLVNLKANIEGNIRTKYSISENIKNVYTDEVSLEVEANSKVSYLFNWKRILQKGFIKCFDRIDREFAFIPFKVVIGVTFDIITE
ncbi:hypothetical protein [Mastigocoleus sp. MO_188.B34]|uniref:hypothetical protein n=1 Tax=Mastigocoleus sp. MO_188.B34 TaxID=3036635 RepID=UPI00263313E3|nr:hypothetical protein [Mastigocoleus sp. MO_188.B34]MDJ0697516.1 hypothetical protein [Mastigocoleus sp. MO_188.B34]